MTQQAPNQSQRVFAILAPLIAIVAIFVLADGNERTGLPPAQGTRFHGPEFAPATRPSLRVGTFNIRGGLGVDGKTSLLRISSHLTEMDFVGLQEVRGRLFGRDVNDARALGEMLSASWLFAPTERRWWHDHFGNGALSRVKVDSWMQIPLRATQTRGFRNALVVRMPFDGKTLTIIVTHIDRRDDHEAQLTTVFNMFLGLPEPVVLMGDLNTRARDVQLARVLATPGVEEAAGKVLGADPGDRIDFILLRGLTAMRAGIEDRGASDHPFVWAEIRLR
jgi:endonuclease/exonuclease/phosphatase family metal-dependent hydrolase